MGGDSQQKKEFKQQKQKGDQKHKKFAKKSYTGSSMPAQMRPKHKFNKQERKAFKQNLQKEAEELEKRIAKEAPPKSVFFSSLFSFSSFLFPFFSSYILFFLFLFFVFRMQIFCQGKFHQLLFQRQQNFQNFLYLMTHKKVFSFLFLLTLF